jgi:paraquat-inducible protein B
VLIRHNQSSNDFSMPVLITIDKKLAQAKSDESLQIGVQARLDHLIERGFRARLDSESLVTGVLYIGLDIVPNAPPPVFHQLTPEYREIPTLPSDIQQLLANLAHLDIRGLSEKLNGFVARLDTGVSKLDFPEGVLVKRVDGRVDPLVDSATNTLYDAQKTMAGVRVAFRNVADLLGPDSAVRPDLTQALEDLGNAGRAVADLAEFLKRNPTALVAGTKRPKEQP